MSNKLTKAIASLVLAALAALSMLGGVTAETATDDDKKAEKPRMIWISGNEPPGGQG